MLAFLSALGVLNPHKKSHQGCISIMPILKMIHQRFKEVKQLSQNCNCRATYMSLPVSKKT